MKTILSTFAVVALIITASTTRVSGQESEAGKKTDATTTSVDTAATTKTEAATEKADTEADGVTAELFSVTRTDGDTVTIKFRYSNGSQKEVELSHELTGYSPNNLAAMVYYIDGKNKKKYSVIKDTGNEFVCSNMKSLKLEPGSSKSGWSKLPAPPAGVAAISVFLPGTPPFEGVKVGP